MAQIKQNVLGVLKGKVGSLTTYSNNTGNVARIRTNATNVGEGASRSRLQQMNRVRWANLVNFYKASKPWMPKAFESKAKNRSDYNQFMSINYANAKNTLTRQEAAAGACVVEGFLISQGSLTPVQVQKHGDHFDTNIKIGTLALSADTTVAEFAQAVVDNNNWIREGMQLSCISYQQIIDDLGTPRVICTPYEMVLDTKNTEEKALAFLPDFCMASEDGLLVTSNNISLGGFAFVLSETVSGRTMVSTQSLIINNTTLIAQYTSAEQQTLAIKSYGVDGTVFLDSDIAYPKAATPQPLYIEKVLSKNGAVLLAGSRSITVNELTGLTSSASAAITMSGDFEASAVSKVSLSTFDDGKLADAVVFRIEERVILFYLSEDAYANTHKLSQITVTIAGTEYTIPFSAE